MARIHRRRFLKLSGAGAITASAGGGLAGILASGRAPAYAQATSVHYLRWSDFVPASDKLLKEKIAPQCEKDLGIKLNYGRRLMRCSQLVLSQILSVKDEYMVLSI